ncbi:hypothetical protein ACTFIU_003452 [Dictyostelium citrinum]
MLLPLPLLSKQLLTHYCQLIGPTPLLNSPLLIDNDDSGQKQQVNALYAQLYQGNVYEGSQCMIGIIECSGDTVIGINIFTMVPVTVTVDFSVFEDLTYIISSSAISFSPHIFTRLPNFTSQAFVKLGKMDSPIPEDLVLPNNLNAVIFENIQVPVPSAFFSTGTIESFITTGAGQGFSLPEQFPQNNYLKELYVIILENCTFPSNAGSSLNNLTSLTLNINNQVTTNITFPTFEPFNQLDTFYINFQESQPTSQIFKFEPSINNIKTLRRLRIENLGFNYSTSIDITNLTNKLELTLSKYIDQLNNFKFPLNCEVYLVDYAVSINGVDFRNVSILSLTRVKHEETLPPASSFDFEMMKYLDLSGNNFYGDLPEEYCSFGKDVLNIGSNDISGLVPDCFRCLGGAEFPGLFPNDFTDFDKNTPAFCATFSLDVTVNQLLKTNETTVLEFTGSNIGWESEIESSQVNVQLEITEPNKKIKVTIPPGAGKQNATLKFGSNLSFDVTLNYEYLNPSIDSYYLEGSGIFFRGSYFSYNENYQNLVKINNNNTFSATILTIEAQNLNKGIGFSNDDTPLSVLKNNCESFNVSIDVAGKQSSTETFIYFGNITMLTNISSIQLNTTGGDFSFDGEFGCITTDFSNPIFKINDIDVQILEITETRINITYPPIENAGTYSLYIEVGDFSYTTEIQFIVTPTFPPTPTPTPTSPTPKPTSTPNDDDDSLSTSSKLSFSLIYFFSVILLISFVF